MDEYEQKPSMRIDPSQLLRFIVDAKVESVIQFYSVPEAEPASKKPKGENEYRYDEDHRTDYE